ncbi:hypothetical protein BGZ96_008771 [Linnemannia gamsii]|uniref:SET domain-containing protein n=1 Tax=Linnemannia gamsii TaxID=64522 RepID=A0ABQ7JYV7_9FUNG|nr:hypothetical protein BGZ96_008771 [Linnemannia gamsii]
MDKDVRLPQDASRPLVPKPTHAALAQDEEASSSSQSPTLTHGGGRGGHVSEIDPSLLPTNWPKHVNYLVNYEYHPTISASVLDLVQGRRRKLSKRAKNHRTAAEGGTESRGEADNDEEEEEDEEAGERSELEMEYDDIPLGDAIPGYLPPVSLSGHLETVPPAVSVSAMDLSSSLLAAVNLTDSQPTIAFSPAVIAPRVPLLSPSSIPDPSLPSSATALDQLASTALPSQKPPPYEIRLITGPPKHPVLGSYGLFATKNLRPGLHLLDYISLVTPDESADPDSDHTLYLTNDLNLDASVHGNHGRFVNDFRGIRTQTQGPNVGWDLYRDRRTGQVRMGCKVLKFIGKGEEIVCTYGKAYWKSRGLAVGGEEWEDGWDTDLEDGKDVFSDNGDDDDDKH